MKKTLLFAQWHLKSIVVGTLLLMGIGLQMVFGTITFSCQQLTNPTGGPNGNGGGGRDNIGAVDSCTGNPACGGNCSAYFLDNSGSIIPNGSYCLQCYGEGCGYPQTGILDCVVFPGTCHVGSGSGGDGGVNPCYCQFPITQSSSTSYISLCGGAS